jgi:hypothetical protein
LRGEGKEGRRLQAAPNQGEAQQGRGSKQLSYSAVSKLDNKEGGDIQAYPRWRHTPSKDQTKRLSGRHTKTLSIRQSLTFGQLPIDWQLTHYFYFRLFDCLINIIFKFFLFIHQFVVSSSSTMSQLDVSKKPRFGPKVATQAWWIGKIREDPIYQYSEEWAKHSD